MKAIEDNVRSWGIQAETARQRERKAMSQLQIILRSGEFVKEKKCPNAFIKQSELPQFNNLSPLSFSLH